MNIKSRSIKGLFLATAFLTVLSLNACNNSNADSSTNQDIDPFAGNWQGSGVDSEGNEATFAAKVIAQGDHKYRVLILDSIDTQKDPMHIMDGIMKENQYIYTSDGGTYVGGGTLDNDVFKGYYKGPVDGTFTMHRMK